MQHAKQATRSGFSAFVAAVAVLSLGAGVAFGAQPVNRDAQRAAKAKRAIESAKANPADTRTFVAEHNIVKDRATGRLRRPTSTETTKLVDDLKKMLSPATADLQATRVAGGGSRIGAQGRFTEVVIARPTADGRMETRCVSSLDEAAAFLGLRQVSGSAPGAVETAAVQ